MTQRLATLGRVLGDGRLRRVELAFLAFGAAEYGVWLAVLVYAYERGGATLAGVIAVVQLIPAAAVAPLATRFVERQSHGAALRAGHAALAASLCLTAAILLLHAPEVIVYAGAVLAASAVTLIRPAQSALLPELVADPADLTAANAMTTWVESASVLIGPALAGALIGVDGPGLAVAVLGAGTAGGTLLVAPLAAGRSHRTPADSQPDDPDVSAGKLDAGVPLVLGLVGLEFVAMGALDVLEIVLAVRVLAIGASGAGYLGAAFGAGGVLGAAGAIGLVGRRHLSGAVLCAAAVSGAAFVALGVWPSVGAAFALLCAFGVARAVLDVASRTLLHRVVAAPRRRRIFGLQEGVSMLGLAAGSIAVPPLVSAGGAEAALIATGGLLLVIATAVTPRLRAVERAAPVPRPALAALTRSPLFALLEPPVLEDLARALVPVAAGVGDVVVREGEPGSVFYLVAAGSLDVSIDGRYVRTIEPGDGFGEIALLRDGIRTATVTARTDASLFTLEREPFLDALTGSLHARRAAEELVIERLGG